MARFAWSDPAARRRRLLDRRLGRLRGRRATACSASSPSSKLPGVVVLGGDVHSNYVADLKADFDDPRVAGRRERVLRHLDHEPRRSRRRASTRRALQPARPLGRATSAATSASSSTARRLTCAPAGGRPAARPGERRHDRGALRRRGRPPGSRSRLRLPTRAATGRTCPRAPSTATATARSSARRGPTTAASVALRRSAQPAVGGVGDAAVRRVARGHLAAADRRGDADAGVPVPPEAEAADADREAGG